MAAIEATLAEEAAPVDQEAIDALEAKKLACASTVQSYNDKISELKTELAVS